VKRLLPLLLLLGCGGQVEYLTLITDRPDITDVAECAFEETEDGWEEYTCVPIFAADDPEAQAWESTAIGDFDIIQREVFGAPIYQLFYSAQGDAGNDIGYALSMDGTRWRRHPWNPILTRGGLTGSWDRDDISVGCVAFDGDAGVYHLWYQGTNVTPGSAGTLFGHATSVDGVLWDKDLQNPLDPLRDSALPFHRVWGCDALYEDGEFHVWISGAHYDFADGLSEPQYDTARYSMGYMSTRDGTFFSPGDDPVLEAAGLFGEAFDAEGVHRPSVFTFGDGSDEPRYWMVYAGYNQVAATPNPSNNLVTFSSEVQSLGMARSFGADRGWERSGDGAVPLDFSGLATADSPRAFFINGRVHVFFRDEFPDPLGQFVSSGIGLGIAPFPREAE
jgi:hypothetical protein